MPQFDISSFSSQIFWLSIVFGSLYFLVSKFIVPKAESILVARNRYLEDNVKHAKQFHDKIKLLEIQRQKNLALTKEKVALVRQEAMQKIDQYLSDQQSSLNIAIEQKHQQSLQELANYVENFRLQQTKSSIEIAAFIIKKITNNKTNMELLQQICGKMK